MIPLPNLIHPFVDRLGKLRSPWNSYLQQFTQAPPAILPVTVGVSPFNYQAKEPGNLSITGGTINSVALSRGSDFIIVTGQNLIFLAIDDIVTITYSVLPTVRFLPIFGQRTG